MNDEKRAHADRMVAVATAHADRLVATAQSEAEQVIADRFVIFRPTIWPATSAGIRNTTLLPIGNTLR